jgi:sarcosine oxidase subunit gamma
MSPQTLPRRSFVYRRLREAGFTFTDIGDAALAQRSTRSDARLKLIDLSPVPRWGLKGRGIAAWLARHGVAMPGSDNRAELQADGSVLARLSPAEVLILAPLRAEARLADAIARMPPEGEDACYPVSRRDSHCCFVVASEDAAKMFAKLCAIDLAPDRFPQGQVAQTSVARLSAILIRNDINDALAFYLLAESASAEYLWDCLTDAMTEFSGAVCGIESLVPSC